MSVIEGPWGDSGGDGLGGIGEVIDTEGEETVEQPPAAGGPAHYQPQLEGLWNRLDRAMGLARTASSRTVSILPPGSEQLSELLDTYKSIQSNVAELGNRLEAVGGRPGPDLLDIDTDLRKVEKQVQGFVTSAERAIESTGQSAKLSGTYRMGQTNGSGGFNPLYLAFGAGVALVGVSVWQMYKTQQELNR